MNDLKPADVPPLGALYAACRCGRMVQFTVNFDRYEHWYPQAISTEEGWLIDLDDADAVVRCPDHRQVV